MSVIVTDYGFRPEDWAAGFLPLSRFPAVLDADAPGLEIGPTTRAERLRTLLPRLRAIRIVFPDFCDPRGFALAGRLRAMGFAGRLRAAGHVLAAQYTMARRAGFDEVEISANLAHRQPEEHWRFRGNWPARGIRWPPAL